MKPHFSDETKSHVVRDFLIARKNRHIIINSFDAIVPFLNQPRVKLLCPLKKSGLTQGHDSYGFTIWTHTHYTNADAETYFEWLVAVVSGTEHENISEDIINQANDQLFRFIDALDLRMDKTVQMIPPYDWQRLFASFDQRLTDMQKIIDKRDKDITEALKSLLQYVSENKNFLNLLIEERKLLFGKEPDD